MKMELTNELPKEPGYYYWTNFGEHTPTIVEVVRNNGKLWAQNEEFCFKIERVNLKKIIAECKKLDIGLIDGHYYGEEMWCRIPYPFLDGKQIEPSCY